jgi:hypothetical protein
MKAGGERESYKGLNISHPKAQPENRPLLLVSEWPCKHIYRYADVVSKRYRAVFAETKNFSTH